jgi:hypothetical protein
MTTSTQLVTIAQAEDTQNLLDHIAWTDVIEPKLIKHKEDLSKMLVNHLLGMPIPENLTKEQLAGQIFGINYIQSLIKGVLQSGERALKILNASGISL